jgi:simple sugar transport system substrate-binding protein
MRRSSTGPQPRLRPIAAFTAVLAAAALIVGCTSAGSSSSGETGSPASAHKPTSFDIEFIAFAPSSDPFWNVVNHGAQQAAQDLGVTVHYVAPTAVTLTGSVVTSMFNEALARHPAGMVVTDPNPAALNPLIKKATSSGTPVIIINQGVSYAKEDGALTYVGSNEGEAGKLAGQRMTAAGVKHVLLVTIPPGNPTGDWRTSGFESGYQGKITTLDIPDQNLNNASAITSAIQAELLKNPTIDGVFGITSLFAASMESARASLASRANSMTWACFDLDSRTIQAVRSGAFLFTIDQQEFLQGYLPVLQLVQYIRYGITPVLSFEPTGPLFVTRSNVTSKLVTLDMQGIR